MAPDCETTFVEVAEPDRNAIVLAAPGTTKSCWEPGFSVAMPDVAVALSVTGPARVSVKLKLKPETAVPLGTVMVTKFVPLPTTVSAGGNVNPEKSPVE